MDALTFIILCCIAIAAVVTVIVALWLRRHQANVLESVASTLELRFVKAGPDRYPSAHGKVGGVEVSVHTQLLVAGKDKWGNERTLQFTLIRSDVGRFVPAGLGIRHEGIPEKLGKAVGRQDLQVGDPDLDRAFIITGDSLPEVTALITHPSVKRALLIGHNRCPQMRIENGSSMVRMRGRPSSAKKLELQIRSVADLARAIKQANHPHEESTSTPTAGAW